MKSFGKLRKEACWTGYKAKGVKKKGDRMVPNCVPEEVQLQEEDGYPHEVHVRNYDEPDDENSTFPKDHINYGINIHHGTYKGATDKGYVFGFREKEDANKFVHHVNTHKHTHAEHLSEEITEAVDKKDTVTVDIPLLIRLLEHAREDIKSDMDLHRVVEKLISIRNNGALTMADYDTIVAIKEDVEQIQEIGDTEKGRDALKSYRQKAILDKTYSMIRPSAPDALDDRKWKNRHVGINRAKKKLGEDGIVDAGPTNTTGSGAVAGMGQPPGSKSGEPGVHPMRKRKVVLLPMGRRTPPKM
jgi:hypothetical protein